MHITQNNSKIFFKNAKNACFKPKIICKNIIYLLEYRYKLNKTKGAPKMTNVTIKIEANGLMIFSLPYDANFVKEMKRHYRKDRAVWNAGYKCWYLQPSKYSDEANSDKSLIEMMERNGAKVIRAEKEVA